MTLSDILNVMEPEFKIFNERFQNIMTSNVPLIDAVAKYMVKHKGKNLRPMLVLMTSKLCGTPTDHTYTAAAVVELLHSATLIHDDVIDDSDLRRGFPSIKAKWKNKIAILMGDYLLSKSLIGASDTENIDVIRILSNSAKRLTKGELQQLSKSKKLDMSEEEYIDMISNKTAALLSACAALGGATTNASKEQMDALADFGENLGIAFQIKDDLLDYESKAMVIGKPAAGSDLKEKKLTLPIIFALKNTEPKQAKSIIKKINKSMKNSDVNNVIQFVKDAKGIEYANEKAVEYAEKAKSALTLFPDSDNKTHIFKFIDYVITRKK